MANSDLTPTEVFDNGAGPVQTMKGHVPSVIAGFSGWTLDSFDFFLVVFCLTSMAKEFGKSDKDMALALTMTLLFRPVGAFIFGMMADRLGRRMPLMVNIGFFAVAEIMTALSPNYWTLMVVRAVFGIVMGGNWGVSTSLALEGAPVSKRGVISGLLQEGYAAGNMLAAISFLFLFNKLGWRPLFFLGSLPAILLVLFIRFKVRESPVWISSVQKIKKTLTRAEKNREILSHWKLFAFLVAFMTMMLFASHGTQDMYPTFLQRQWHFTPQQRSVFTLVGGAGAIFGGLLFGHLSSTWGRRRTIIIAFVIGLIVIWPWAFASSKAVLMLGVFLIQFAVQGAWGIVPVHLAELSPTSVRGLLPGLAYQTAGIIASSVVYIEPYIAEKRGYGSAMAIVAAVVFILASIMTALSKERRGESFEN